MKRIYILILIVIATFTLACLEKDQADTTTGSYGGNSDLAKGIDRNQAVTTGEVPLTPEPGEDLGTYSELAEMDNISSDLDMQIALSNEI